MNGSPFAPMRPRSFTLSFLVFVLHRQDLAVALPEALQVPTILTDLPFRQFDALFHWED